MGRSRYKIQESYYPYFMSSSIVDGISLLSKPILADIIIQGLNYLAEDQEVTVFAYVIMPDHMHIVAEAEDLGKKIRLFKSYTARSIIASMRENKNNRYLRFLKRAKLNHKQNTTYQVWQEGYHPIQIFNADIAEQKISYVHFNPVVAGFVDRPEYWRYSSAVDYSGGTGLVPIRIYGE